MISILFISGVFTLLLNTIKDIRTSTVDDRLNYLMMGSAITYMIFMQNNPVIYWSAIGFSLLISIVLLRFTSVGLGDVSAFNWITIALSTDSLLGLAYFWLMIGVCLVLVSLRNRRLQVRTPFYPIIFACFILSYMLG